MSNYRYADAHRAKQTSCQFVSPVGVECSFGGNHRIGYHACSTQVDTGERLHGGIVYAVSYEYFDAYTGQPITATEAKRIDIRDSNLGRAGRLAAYAALAAADN